MISLQIARRNSLIQHEKFASHPDAHNLNYLSMCSYFRVSINPFNNTNFILTRVVYVILYVLFISSSHVISFKINIPLHTHRHFRRHKIHFFRSGPAVYPICVETKLNFTINNYCSLAHLYHYILFRHIYYTFTEYLGVLFQRKALYKYLLLMHNLLNCIGYLEMNK